MSPLQNRRLFCVEFYYGSGALFRHGRKGVFGSGSDDRSGV
jgi:hypothetical protein